MQIETDKVQISHTIVYVGPNWRLEFLRKFNGGGGGGEERKKGVVQTEKEGGEREFCSIFKSAAWISVIKGKNMKLGMSNAVYSVNISLYYVTWKR
jgi:hypothetical protein